MAFVSVPIRQVTTLPMDSASNDAFGRDRVSNPVTLFDSKQLNDNQPLFWSDVEASGSGTSSSHSTLTASTTMSVSASTAGKRVRQTKRRMDYQPGKSQLIVMTGQFVNQESNLTDIVSGMGYVDDNNGLYFEQDEGVLSAVVRTNTSGTPVENSKPQSQWNIDKMDGSGKSGINLSLTTTLIPFWDIEWLGVGRCRFGWFIDGKPFYCHEFNHANILSLVYMQTANLPLSYWIENKGTGPATSMQHICATVISEGGRQDSGLVTAISNDLTEVSAATGGTYYALKGFRLKSTHLTSTLIPESVSTAITATGAYEWQLRFNPTVTGTFTYSDVDNTSYQEATGAGATVTGGLIIGQGYGASSGSGGSASGSGESTLKNALLAGAAYDGTRDEVVLCASALANTKTFLGGITIREVG